MDQEMMDQKTEVTCSNCNAGIQVPDPDRWICPYCATVHGSPPTLAQKDAEPAQTGRVIKRLIVWNRWTMVITLLLCVVYVGWENGGVLQTLANIQEQHHLFPALQNVPVNLQHLWQKVFPAMQEGLFENLLYVPGQVFNNLMEFMKGVIEK